jgi:hydrogenase maturation factor
MLVHDAQTSGGLLMSVPPDLAGALVEDLNQRSALTAAEIGEVLEESPRRLYFE